MRQADAATTTAERQFDAQQEVINWEHRLRTEPPIGFEPSSFANLLKESGQLPLTLTLLEQDVMVTRPMNEDEIREHIFPGLVLLIQDNFLTVISPNLRQIQRLEKASALRPGGSGKSADLV